MDTNQGKHLSQNHKTSYNRQASPLLKKNEMAKEENPMDSEFQDTTKTGELE